MEINNYKQLKDSSKVSLVKQDGGSIILIEKRFNPSTGEVMNPQQSQVLLYEYEKDKETTEKRLESLNLFISDVKAL